MASTQKCSAADVIAVLEPRHSAYVAGDAGGGAPGA